MGGVGGDARKELVVTEGVGGDLKEGHFDRGRKKTTQLLRMEYSGNEKDKTTTKTKTRRRCSATIGGGSRGRWCSATAQIRRRRLDERVGGCGRGGVRRLSRPPQTLVGGAEVGV